MEGPGVKSVVCNQNSLSSDCQLEDKQWWEHCKGHRDNSTMPSWIRSHIIRRFCYCPAQKSQKEGNETNKTNWVFKAPDRSKHYKVEILKKNQFINFTSYGCVGWYLYTKCGGQWGEAPAPVYYLWPHYAGSQYPQRLGPHIIHWPVSGYPSDWCQQAHGGWWYFVLILSRLFSI